MRAILITTTLLAACFFLLGVDAGLDKQDQATRQDRARIYCNTPRHNETLCKGMPL